MTELLGKRALIALFRNSPSTEKGERYGWRAMRMALDRRDILLRWAATMTDSDLLELRNFGKQSLAWTRQHQPEAHGDGTPVRMIPEASLGGTFAEVIKRTGWRVELFWNGSGGWFTARLISPWDRDGNAAYPGGFLAPFDNPIGTSGATPAEALANLSEAVLEWA